MVLNRDWDWLTRGVAQDHLLEHTIHPWIEIGETQPSARSRTSDDGGGGGGGGGGGSQAIFFGPLGLSLVQMWYVQSTVNKAQSNGAKSSDFLPLVISIYNVSSLNYLGLAKRLQVAQRSLTPLFSCSSKARSVNSSRLEFVSFKFSPSGAMSLAK